MIQEVVSIFIGVTGAIAGVVSVWITFRKNKSSTDIDWYDRAINEVERLENRLNNVIAKLKEMEKKYELAEEQIKKQEKIIEDKHVENIDLKGTIAELKEIIKDLRAEIRKAQERIEKDYGTK